MSNEQSVAWPSTAIWLLATCLLATWIMPAKRCLRSPNLRQSRSDNFNLVRFHTILLLSGTQRFNHLRMPLYSYNCAQYPFNIRETHFTVLVVHRVRVYHQVRVPDDFLRYNSFRRSTYGSRSSPSACSRRFPWPQFIHKILAEFFITCVHIRVHQITCGVITLVLSTSVNRDSDTIPVVHRMRAH